jgi:hypothetical protein
MILYLQKNYDGTFAIAEKNNHKSELFPCDYYTLLDNISKEMTYQELANLVIEKFGCKKLVLNF